MKKDYKRILIVNTFGIGDVLFSTPLIKAVKVNMPHAIIDFICNKRVEYILQNNRHIDRIIVFEKDFFREALRRSKLYFVKEFVNFIKKIRSRQYDLAIDLSLGHQISLLLKLLCVRKRIGFNYRNRGRFLTDKLDINGFNDKHAVEHYLDILKLLGIKNVVDKNLELTVSPEYDQWADEFICKHELESKTLVGIAPGGGKSWGSYALYRRWSPENFSYVAEKLSRERKNIFFLIFGSLEEEDPCCIIEENLQKKSMSLCGKLSLPHSIALIKKCKLMLCNDGGVLHIAVSQDVKTVSIFGPVNDNVYGPYPPSDRYKVVKAEDITCRPCYRNFKHKMCETHDCLKNIDKDEVLKIAEESLAKPAEAVDHRR